MGYRALRVINDDRVAPGMGFGRHPHRDAEIFSYVVKGALAHADSLGHEETVHAGEVQYMSAGAGVEHSEFNGSAEEEVHFLQVWLLPGGRGGEPRYATIPASAEPGLRLILSRDGREGSVEMRAQADVHLGQAHGGGIWNLDIPSGSGVWVQVATGSLTAAGIQLAEGDGVALEGLDRLSIETAGQAGFLVFVLG